LTAATQNAVCELLLVGCTLTDCARRLQIDRRTLTRWRQRGAAYSARRADGAARNATEEPFGVFWTETEKAKVSRKARALTVVHDLMQSLDPKVRLQAATWYLERAYADEFGRQTRHEVGGTVKLDTPEAVAAAREDALKLVDELAARRATSNGSGNGRSAAS
jgi:transcriptional regulator with XRE-family HTH domain